MKQTDSSPLFPIPFGAQADSGTLTQIPPSKTAIGRASLALGFPKETFTPIAAGGVPPYGEDMNGILNMLSQAVRASEAGQVRPFSASYAQQIGGYPKGAVVSAPNDPTRLFISTQDDNSADPTQGGGSAWFTLSDIANQKLNRTGDTTSGNLTYQSDVQAGPWASTPQTLFRFQNSKALGAIFGQIRDDGSFQTLLYAQNVDGVNKAWGFRSNDGHVSTPNGHVLLEVDDAGNGHLVAQNIGSASGKTLANMDDVTAESTARQNATTALDQSKLNRTGDTTSGNLVYQSNTQVAPWASTPQAIFQFGGSKALGAIFGQIRDDGSFQTLLYAQNVDGVNKAWAFRSNDGHVSTPNGHVLLEVDDAGNGHLVAQNIGSASGKTLAITDDVAAESAARQNAIVAEATTRQGADAALDRAKLNRAGDTSSGNIAFNSGNAYQPWAASPQVIFGIGGGLMSTWSQVDGNGNIQLLLGGNNPGNPYSPWVFKPTQSTITTPTGNNVLETANVVGPRFRQTLRVQVANGGYVAWPKPFARDDAVIATLNPQDGGSGQVRVANTLYNTTPNRFGMFVAVTTFESWQLTPQTSPITMDIDVEGYAA